MKHRWSVPHLYKGGRWSYNADFYIEAILFWVMAWIRGWHPRKIERIKFTE